MCRIALQKDQHGTIEQWPFCWMIFMLDTSLGKDCFMLILNNIV